jgi:hypothetical protein
MNHSFHRSCYEDLGQYAQAVTFFRAALSVPLPADYRAGTTGAVLGQGAEGIEPGRHSQRVGELNR